MAITLVQQPGFTAVGVTTLAYGSANTAGNFLLAFGADDGNGGAALSFTDSKGNAWNSAIATGVGAIYYAMNCLAGANTVTMHGGSAFSQFAIYEFSGVATTNALDQFGEGLSLTTTAAGELVFADMRTSSISGYQVPTLAGGFSALQTIEGHDGYPHYKVSQDAYQILASAGTASISGWTYTGREDQFMASFFAGSGGGAPTIHLLGCLGAGS